MQMVCEGIQVGPNYAIPEHGPGSTLQLCSEKSPESLALGIWLEVYRLYHTHAIHDPKPSPRDRPNRVPGEGNTLPGKENISSSLGTLGL